MTTVTVFTRNGAIESVESKGHAGYARSGKDVVCAAVSVAVQSGLAGLCEVAKVEVKTKEGEGYLRYEIGGQDAKRVDVKAILETVRVTVRSIAKQYPRYVKLEEVDNAY